MESRPLIVHVIQHLIMGGLENGLVNLINRMPEDRYRHAIVCLSHYSEFRERISRPDVEVFALHKREGKDFGVYWKLWRLLRRLSPAIVHTRNVGTVDCSVVAWAAGVPHRIHGQHGFDLSDFRGGNRKYMRLRRACRPFIERQVALSRESAQWLEKEIGVSRDKITQVYNGVDEEKFCAEGGARPAPPLPGFDCEGSIVIGTVERMQDVKDPMNLARAFVQLRKQEPELGPRLRLVMVGDGPLRQIVEEFLAENGCDRAAWFPGAVENVPDYLRAFDIFALPSKIEGISNTILEAMATGLPIVATDVGGNAELVVEGETGFIVPAQNPEALAGRLAEYARDPELRVRHGAKARSRVLERFSLSAMVRQYCDLYDGVLGRDSR